MATRSLNSNFENSSYRSQVQNVLRLRIVHNYLLKLKVMLKGGEHGN